MVHPSYPCEMSVFNKYTYMCTHTHSYVNVNQRKIGYQIESGKAYEQFEGEQMERAGRKKWKGKVI